MDGNNVRYWLFSTTWFLLLSEYLHWLCCLFFVWKIWLFDWVCECDNVKYEIILCTKKTVVLLQNVHQGGFSNELTTFIFCTNYAFIYFFGFFFIFQYVLSQYFFNIPVSIMTQLIILVIDTWNQLSTGSELRINWFSCPRLSSNLADIEPCMPLHLFPITLCSAYLQKISIVSSIVFAPIVFLYYIETTIIPAKLTFFSHGVNLLGMPGLMKAIVQLAESTNLFLCYVFIYSTPLYHFTCRFDFSQYLRYL